MKKDEVFEGRVHMKNEREFKATEFWTAAERQERDDLSKAQTSALWPRAVQWLRLLLTPGMRAEIRAAMTRGEWPARYHFGWGMGIRNDLRRAGFGEKEFGIGNLDNIYARLVEEAVGQPAANATPAVEQAEPEPVIRVLEDAQLAATLAYRRALQERDALERALKEEIARLEDARTKRNVLDQELRFASQRLYDARLALDRALAADA